MHFKFDNSTIARLNRKTANYKINSFSAYLLSAYLHIENDVTIFESKKRDKKIVINPYQQYILKITKVEDDYIYVECDMGCDGCSNDERVKGWVKWRGSKGEMIINVRFQC